MAFILQAFEKYVVEQMVLHLGHISSKFVPCHPSDYISISSHNDWATNGPMLTDI